MIQGLFLTMAILVAPQAAPPTSGSPPVPRSTAGSLDAMSVDQLLRQARDAMARGDDTQVRAALATARAKLELPDPRITFNEAVSAYRQGDFDTARDLFETAGEEALASDNRGLSSAAAYNLGNAAHRHAMQSLQAESPQAQVRDTSQAINALQEAQDQLADALDHYRAAIARETDDADARANAELTWQRMQELRQQQQELEQQQQEQEQEQEQQQQQQQNQEQQGDQSQQDEQQQQEQQEQQQQQQQQSEQGQGDQGQDEQEQEQEQEQQDQQDQQDQQQQPQDQQQQQSQLEDQLEHLQQRREDLQEMLDRLERQEPPLTEEQEKQLEDLQEIESLLDQLEQEIKNQLEELEEAGKEELPEAQEAAGNPTLDENMTREEAQRLLQRVRDREKARREAREEAQSRGPASTGKDW